MSEGKAVGSGSSRRGPSRHERSGPSQFEAIQEEASELLSHPKTASRAEWPQIEQEAAIRPVMLSNCPPVKRLSADFSKGSGIGKRAPIPDPVIEVLLVFLKKQIYNMSLFPLRKIKEIPNVDQRASCRVAKLKGAELNPE